MKNEKISKKEIEAIEENSIHIEDDELVFIDYFDEHTGNIGDLNISVSPVMQDSLNKINQILSQYI